MPSLEKHLTFAPYPAPVGVSLAWLWPIFLDITDPRTHQSVLLLFLVLQATLVLVYIAVLCHRAKGMRGWLALRGPRLTLQLRVDGRVGSGCLGDQLSLYGVYSKNPSVCGERYDREQGGLAEPWLIGCVAVYRVLFPLCLRQLTNLERRSLRKACSSPYQGSVQCKGLRCCLGGNEGDIREASLRQLHPQGSGHLPPLLKDLQWAEFICMAKLAWASKCCRTSVTL